jgi:outer membrane protein TolC
MMHLSSGRRYRIPAELLQRRLDIAFAERTVAAANANIGVTKAAFLPDLSLGLNVSPWLAENGAKYRSIVLRTFQQIEDNLAPLHHLGDESSQEQDALASAQRTLTLAMSRYRDGVVNYLDVVTAQTTELDTEIRACALYTRRLTAAVIRVEQG